MPPQSPFPRLEAKHVASISPLPFRHAQRNFHFVMVTEAILSHPRRNQSPPQETSELELLHTHNGCNLRNRYSHSISTEEGRSLIISPSHLKVCHHSEFFACYCTESSNALRPIGFLTRHKQTFLALSHCLHPFVRGQSPARLRPIDIALNKCRDDPDNIVNLTDELHHRVPFPRNFE